MKACPPSIFKYSKISKSLHDPASLHLEVGLLRTEMSIQFSLKALQFYITHIAYTNLTSWQVFSEKDLNLLKQSVNHLYHHQYVTICVLMSSIQCTEQTIIFLNIINHSSFELNTVLHIK